MLMWTALAVWLFSTASGASSYMLVPKPKPWTDAEAFCQAKFGTNLAIFRTKWEAFRILILAKLDLLQNDHFEGHPWIGLNDRANEGIWLFSDGTGCPLAANPCTRAVFPPWRDNPNYPSGGIHENCGAVDSHATKITSMVFDDLCVLHRHFICDYDPAPGDHDVSIFFNLFIYDEDDEDDEDDEVDLDLILIVDDAQVQKIPCSEAGLTLGIPHECTCSASTTCDQEDRFCNTYEFVYSVVGGLVPPEELVCADDVWHDCCCSCQNCPDWIPFSV